ncbi:barstar family protein [Streptomyces sp. NPDC056670]|uniref:barstar family protein n=1 Tax=Streptomyces sp. NPDC056670 TaxID=3345904 RepID=UPI003678AF50
MRQALGSLVRPSDWRTLPRSRPVSWSKMPSASQRAKMNFPDYYGHNLDALNDCLGDVACYGGYDDAPEGAGLVLSFTNYDRFSTACPRAAQVVLEIIADRARQAAVLHRRLICLVQSDDPQIRFEPVGAMPVLWNSDEGSDASRGA